MQDIGRRANVSFDLLAASDYISGSFFVGGGSRPFLFDGPRQAGVAGSYTFPLKDGLGLQAYGRIYNLFNQTYFEDGFQNPKAWGVAGLKLIF
jgi:outer membrane receptor protein involved in Fe transport